MRIVPQSPPPPARLTVAAPVGVVLQRAAADLLAHRYTIVQSDAGSGTLTARRTYPEDSSAALVRCEYPKNSGFEAARVATMVVSLSAVATGDSSAVTIVTRVLSAYPSLGAPFDEGANDVDCVSSGRVETEVATSVGRANPSEGSAP